MIDTQAFLDLVELRLDPEQNEKPEAVIVHGLVSGCVQIAVTARVEEQYDTVFERRPVLAAAGGLAREVFAALRAKFHRRKQPLARCKPGGKHYRRFPPTDRFLADAAAHTGAHHILSADTKHRNDIPTGELELELDPNGIHAVVVVDLLRAAPPDTSGRKASCQ